MSHYEGFLSSMMKPHSEVWFRDERDRGWNGNCVLS